MVVPVTIFGQTSSNPKNYSHLFLNMIVKVTQKIKTIIFLYGQETKNFKSQNTKKNRQTMFTF